MCRWGDESVDMLNEVDRRARKDHRCFECGRTIAKGETYRYEAWLWEGDFDTAKVCQHCLQVRRWLSAACDGWVYGELAADLAEHVTGDESYLRSRPLTRLLRWMEADWHNRAGELRPVEDVRLVTDQAVEAFRMMT